MKPRRAILASALMLSAACGSNDDALDEAAQEARKRTDPKAGMGGVLLEQPSWLDASWAGPGVLVQGVQGAHDLAPGRLVDLLPGRYDVLFRATGPRGFETPGTSWTVLGHRWPGSGELVAGSVLRVKPAGVRLQFDRPLAWPSELAVGHIESSALQVSNGYGTTAFTNQAPWSHVGALLAKGGSQRVDALLPALAVEVVVGARRPLTLLEGKLETIPSKTVSFAVDLETIDARFPDDPRAAACVLLRGPGGVDEPVRSLSTFKTAILPEHVPVHVVAFGSLQDPGKTVGATRRFALNRLEFADVEVRTTSGTTTRVRGAVRVEAKQADGTLRDLGCLAGSLSTSTGIDVPDGTYRVTSTATGPEGVVTHQENVTFP